MPVDPRTAEPTVPAVPSGARSADGVNGGGREPVDGRTELSPLRAVMRHPLWFILPALACLAIGVAAGLARQPVWTADTRVALGSIDVATQSLPGYVEATRSLAASYSRAIQSEAVVADAAEGTGLPPAEVGDRLSASPVAETPVISVAATGPSEPEAVELANAGTEALVDYVRGSTSQDVAAGVLEEYQRSRARVQRLEARQGRLEAQEEQAGAAGDSQRLREVTTALETERLESEVLAERYRNQLQNRPSPDFVRVLSDATTATSDRLANLQVRAFTGLVVGLVLGLALAAIRASRRRRA